MKNVVMHHFRNHFIVSKQAIMNIGNYSIHYFLVERTRFISLFRLILRCRQLARERFAKMRADVLVKLELLDQKHGIFFAENILISSSSFY